MTSAWQATSPPLICVVLIHCSHAPQTSMHQAWLLLFLFICQVSHLNCSNPIKVVLCVVSNSLQENIPLCLWKTSKSTPSEHAFGVSSYFRWRRPSRERRLSRVRDRRRSFLQWSCFIQLICLRKENLSKAKTSNAFTYVNCEKHLSTVITCEHSFLSNCSRISPCLKII